MLWGLQPLPFSLMKIILPYFHQEFMHVLALLSMKNCACVSCWCHVVGMNSLLRACFSPGRETIKFIALISQKICN